MTVAWRPLLAGIGLLLVTCTSTTEPEPERTFKPQLSVYERITGHTDCDVLRLEADVAETTGQDVYVRVAERRMAELRCPM